jgi:hypothetical protein
MNTENLSELSKEELIKIITEMKNNKDGDGDSEMSDTITDSSSSSEEYDYMRIHIYNNEVLKHANFFVKNLFLLANSNAENIFTENSDKDIIIFGDYIKHLLNGYDYTTSERLVIEIYGDTFRSENIDNIIITNFVNLGFIFIPSIAYISNYGTEDEDYSYWFFTIRHPTCSFDVKIYDSMTPNFCSFNIDNIILSLKNGLDISRLTSQNLKRYETLTTNIMIDNVTSLRKKNAMISKRFNFGNERRLRFNYNKRRIIDDIKRQAELTRHGFYIQDGFIINYHTLENLYECPICYEKQTESIILSCQHSYCINCISRHILINNREHNKQCPLCRERIQFIYN